MRESVTSIFLVKNLSTPARPVGLRLSLPYHRAIIIFSNTIQAFSSIIAGDEGIGHEYFSGEKSLDPGSARRPPPFASLPPRNNNLLEYHSGILVDYCGR